MQPTCCFYGPTSPALSPDKGDLVPYIALIYQIDSLITRGVYEFNTCLLPGVDTLCVSYIANIAIDPNDKEAVARLAPSQYASLRIHVFHIPFSKVFEGNLDTMEILRDAASIHIHKDTSKKQRIKTMIDSSTHMLAVCPEGKNPLPVAYAEKRGVEVMRFTVPGLVAALRGTQKD